MDSRPNYSHLPASSKWSFEDAWGFILRLGAAAHGYGSTASQLEMFLQRMSQNWGYQGTFRSTPSELIFALRESPDLPQRVEVMATPPPGLDLDKLARVGDLLDEIEAGSLTPAKASIRLDDIGRTPPPWGNAAITVSYVLVGLGVAALLGGGWLDIFYSMLFGAMVYGLVVLSGRLGSGAAEWLPLSTALVAGASATVVKVWIPELNVVLVILAGVAVLLPGYTISLGSAELVSQYVVSGTANLMSGLVCLVKQFAGGWLGVMVASSLVPVAAGIPAEPVGSAWLWLIVPLLIIGLCVVFQTSRRDLPWATLGCLIAYLGIMAGNAIFSGNFGNLLGAIVAVIFANLWARRTGRPTSIVLIPAIVLLVSGSIGFRGLATIASGDLVAGWQQFLQMFVVALTILTGVVVGNTVVRPEPTL